MAAETARQKGHVVCRVEELPPGERRIVEVDGRSIGVFNVKGTYYALLNRCPHKAAPLCKGLVKGLYTADRPGEYRIERPGEILRCPWHGWEFNISTGRSHFNPQRLRVRTYAVTVERAILPPDDTSVEAFPVTVEGEVVVLEA